MSDVFYASINDPDTGIAIAYHILGDYGLGYPVNMRPCVDSARSVASILKAKMVMLQLQSTKGDGPWEIVSERPVNPDDDAQEIIDWIERMYEGAMK